MSWLANKKVLAPIDFCEHSKWGLDTAIEIAGKPENVHVLHVAPVITDLAVAATWGIGEEGSIRTGVVQQFQKEFPGAPYASTKFEVRFGDPGNEIARYAEQIGAELIVLPSQGRTGLSHLLIGSVAERVARLSHCPVLILKV